ncbi:hypothetical protein BT69DRAFT_701506 [Atractiella rhizophila]|nr:hypothetical protein BT69DRAFT_701506 [Atractiella rhizophila]
MEHSQRYSAGDTRDTRDITRDVREGREGRDPFVTILRLRQERNELLGKLDFAYTERTLLAQSYDEAMHELSHLQASNSHKDDELSRLRDDLEGTRVAMETFKRRLEKNSEAARAKEARISELELEVGEHTRRISGGKGESADELKKTLARVRKERNKALKEGREREKLFAELVKEAERVETERIEREEEGRKLEELVERMKGELEALKGREEQRQMKLLSSPPAYTPLEPSSSNSSVHQPGQQSEPESTVDAAEIASLHSQLEQKTLLHSEALAGISSLQSANAKLEADKCSLESELRTIRAAHDATIAEKNEIQSLLSLSEAPKSEVQESEPSQDQGKESQEMSPVKEVNEQPEQAEALLEKMVQENRELELQLAALTTALDDERAQAELLREEPKATEENGNMVEVERKNEELKDQNREIGVERDNLRTRLGEAEQSLVHFRARVEELESSLRALEASAGTNLSELTRVKEELRTESCRVISLTEELEVLREENERVKEEKDEMEGWYFQLKDEKAALKGRLEGVCLERDGAKEKVDVLERDLEKALEVGGELKLALDAAREESVVANDARKQMERKTKEVTRELKTELEVSHRALVDTKELSKAKEEAWETMIDELEQRQEEILKISESRNESLEEERKIVLALKDEISSLNAKVLGKAENVEQEVKRAHEEAAALKEEYELQMQSLTGMKDSELSSLRQQLVASQNDLASTESRLETLSHDLSQSRADQAEKDRKIDELFARLDNAEADVQAYETRLENRQEEIEELEIELQETRGQMDRVEDEFHRVREQLASSRLEVAALSETENNIQSAYEELREQLTAQQNQREKSANDAEILRAEVLRLSNHLEESVTALERMEEEAQKAIASRCELEKVNRTLDEQLLSAKKEVAAFMARLQEFSVKAQDDGSRTHNRVLQLEEQVRELEKQVDESSELEKRLVQKISKLEESKLYLKRVEEELAEKTEYLEQAEDRLKRLDAEQQIADDRLYEQMKKYKTLDKENWKLKTMAEKAELARKQVSDELDKLKAVHQELVNSTHTPLSLQSSIAPAEAASFKPITSPITSEPTITSTVSLTGSLSKKRNRPREFDVVEAPNDAKAADIPKQNSSSMRRTHSSVSSQDRRSSDVRRSSSKLEAPEDTESMPRARSKSSKSSKASSKETTKLKTAYSDFQGDDDTTGLFHYAVEVKAPADMEEFDASISPPKPTTRRPLASVQKNTRTKPTSTSSSHQRSSSQQSQNLIEAINKLQQQ